MGAKSSRYSLEVLLKLNDQLSGRLGRSTSALKKFGSQSTSSLKAYDGLRKATAKPLAVASLTKSLSQNY
jgi:hypothetical protein